MINQLNTIHIHSKYNSNISEDHIFSRKGKFLMLIVVHICTFSRMNGTYQLHYTGISIKIIHFKHILSLIYTWHLQILSNLPLVAIILLTKLKKLFYIINTGVQIHLFRWCNQGINDPHFSFGTEALLTVGQNKERGRSPQSN